MSFLPTAEPPPMPPPTTPYLAVSRGGGVFPVGEVGRWPSRRDDEDPAVGIVAAVRGHVVVRRSGRLDAAGTGTPRLAVAPGPVRRVRPVAGRWWALADGGATALDTGEHLELPPGTVDLVGGGEPVSLDDAGRARSPAGDLLDDPGPLDDGLLGAVGGAAGWWLVTTSGRIHGRGGAPDHEPIDTSTYPHPLTAVGPAPRGEGLVVVTADGRVHARGTGYPGGLPRAVASGPIVALSPVGGVRLP